MILHALKLRIELVTTETVSQLGSFNNIDFCSCKYIKREALRMSTLL